jgi:DNA-binding beta-propeller fold protein YncE
MHIIVRSSTQERCRAAMAWRLHIVASSKCEEPAMPAAASSTFRVLLMLTLRGALLGAALGLAGCMSGPTRPEKAAELPVFPPPPEQARYHYERTLYSSADIEVDKASDLQRTLTGELRTGEGLAKPHGVAAYKGRVYVTDTVRRMVAVFDIPARKFSWIGDDGPGALRLPIGVDTDAKGNVYVADATAKRVVVFDPAGAYRAEVGNADMLTRPTGVGVDGAATRLYVVDTGGVATENHRVRVFELPSGKHLFDIGKRGDKPGEFNLPTDVAVAADGSVHVVDSGNFRVQTFDRDGKFVRVFGELGRQMGQFARPKEVAIDPTGNLYVVDAAFGNFQVFDKEARLLLNVGSRGSTNEPAKYMLPAGIAVDGDGRVYVADQYFRKIDVYRPATLAAGAGYAPVAGAAVKAAAGAKAP